MPLQVVLFAALIVGGVGVGVWALQGVNLDLPMRRKVVRANLGPSVESTPDLREVVLSQSAWDRVGVPAIRKGSSLAPPGPCVHTRAVGHHSPDAPPVPHQPKNSNSGRLAAVLASRLFCKD